MEDCLFCKIVAGELPCNEVAATDRTFAFRDINPIAPTHLLVVPREHVRDASQLGVEHAEILAELFTTAREIAAGEGVADGGYRLVFNVGDDAGNTVPHLHLHVIGGRSMTWPPG